jgi:hypothetical protein
VVILALIPAAFVVSLFILARRRKATLAGLNHERPIFTVSPPVRNLYSREDYRL